MFIKNMRVGYVMELITLLGFSAATLTTGASFPQLMKVVRTKRTGDLSFLMCMMVVAGIVLWIAYGLIVKDWPIIIANSIALASYGIILGFKIKYK